MNRKTLLSIGSALVAIGVMSVAGYGCGDDDDNVTTKKDSGTPTAETGTPETGTDAGSKPPAPPMLGAQLDRKGRPVTNVAFNHTFEADAGAAKDDYNKDGDQAGWSAKYTGEMSKNLAIFDGFDTVCGNSFLANADAGATPTAVQVYGAFGGILADDRLWLDANGVTCNTYLAVEKRSAPGALPNFDCGGRALKYDVIDVTYSTATKGTFSGVGDGIDADPVKTAGTVFPFLADPQ